MSTFLKDPDLRHSKMKQVVSAIHEYLQTKREETAVTINMHLQSLSLSIDLSIFDPHNNNSLQFFMSLYELMNKMEQQSSFAWNCVDVLSNACRNPSARSVLIHTYQFIPPLSRLLGDHLSIDKKIRLLRLIQDLTCGIKISWQIPHLPQLMITLSQWIESPNEEIVSLSLGILVNLCYKNIPAIYTFMGNVDVKKILKICCNIQRKSVEINSCKLLVILDYLDNDIPQPVIRKIVSISFDSIAEAFRRRDLVLLRQTVEFFLDVGKQYSVDFLIDNNESYEAQLKHVLDCVVENNHSMDSGDSPSETRDPECVALIFEFLNYCIEINLAATPKMFPIIIELALKWIQTDLVSPQALSVLKSVAIKVDENHTHILEPLVKGLPIFLMTLNQTRSDNVENCKNISGVLLLLRAMLQVAAIRDRIIKDLSVEMLSAIFEPLIGDNCFRGLKSKEIESWNLDSAKLYVHGIALVTELARFNSNWLNLQTDLFKRKEIHMVMAQCLYESSTDMKKIVLELLSNPNKMPYAMIAEAMSTIQPVLSSTKSSSSSTIIEPIMSAPVMPITHLKRINEILTKFESIFAQGQENSIVTSDVIELYDYKIAAMANAERSAMNSAEAASERCTQLTHRNAELTAELNKLHQMFVHVQQLHKQTSDLKDKLQESVNVLKTRGERDAASLKAFNTQIKKQEQQINEQSDTIENLTKKYDRLLEEKSQLDDQYEKLKQVAAKLEDNGLRLEKVHQKKEETIKKCNSIIENLNAKVAEITESLAQKELVIQKIMQEKQELKQELELKQNILKDIMKFAAQGQFQGHNV